MESLPIVGQVSQIAFERAHAWFGRENTRSFEIWFTGDASDLFFMTSLHGGDLAAYAPGVRNGKAIIILYIRRCDSSHEAIDKLVSVVAHEFSHHIIRDMAGASPYTMRRRQENDLPMWVEEGLCVVVQASCREAVHAYYVKSIDATSDWYALAELWDDLSDLPDVNKAYAQAYREVRSLLESFGKGVLLGFLGKVSLTACGGGNFFNMLARSAIRRRKHQSGIAKGFALWPPEASSPQEPSRLSASSQDAGDDGGGGKPGE